MAGRVHQPQEDAEFEFILARADVPVLAYFHGTWPKAVAACKEMEPLVREVADAYQGRLIVVRADIARCPGPVRRYGVTGAPSFVLIERGEATAAGSGPMARAALGEFLDAHL
ncbi:MULTISPECIES: thioredoxin family protein [Streptomyces]|uniref:Thiol reductase thioredoxin n=1 Tax=Streptomyces tsukubensis (strain DSM 42081 / NBRC 108919 / NRRL 18488 / 9993) TaxID=1114943 RepID=I2N9T0_STRT9|nr:MULTISPECIES: thioredoxin domain-containing protein [Streptomyces]AZK97601.1 thiol reductase thioredoxin [Streptomyces tsukubensis]EIF93777.1 thioredoxin [Streptomyces tsukubensis NRRL18488]MYS66104.1 thiol reductase thioredoxin [Streptomyces sp. SID5473]QKM66457.1 thiol reductase thioredoxin [Streptomyces tsukubensis NRRL18488]TAI45204.1 thiol reductase thioredoxin [Streptomyces tsukubensis]